MKDKYYKILVEDLDTKDEIERLMVVNNRIDEIVLKEFNPQQALEALICMFRSKSINSTGYTIMSIAYAVGLAVVSLITDEIVKKVIGVVLGVIVIVIALLAFKASKGEEKNAFVLNALDIRYEKMKKDNGYIEKMKQEDSAVYYVKVIKKEEL